ncbi:MAG: hypothetical protein NC215_07540 [Ruminococcus sp.]|nr:hypothetical protein [Ruminococcus sp.]MCM1392875.1 hypothetical protein [Ruminococcus sp.]
MNSELINKYEKNVKQLRTSVLIVTLLSLADVILCTAKPLTGLPFTAFTPHLAMTACYTMTDEETGMLGFYIGVFLAVVIVFAYFILFLMMRKKQRRTISALVFYTLDTALLIYGVFFLMPRAHEEMFIFDFAFHIWMMVTAIKGVIAFTKLKKISRENTKEQ